MYFMSDAPSHDGAADDKPSILRRLVQLLRGQDAASAIRESLEEMIEESDRQSPALSAPERLMLSNLLKFGEMRVRDVMIPRANIVAVEESLPLTQLIALFREAQHSRLPVYRKSLDDCVGLVHLKDVIALIEPKPDGGLSWLPGSIASIRREVLFVPPSMPLLDLLLHMQKRHMHMALVIDEYGGTDGLVSIEDVIEEIVGEIDDEHDEEALELRAVSGAYLADARVTLEDFKTETGIALDQGLDDEAEDIDTLGGLAVSLLGRVPQRGEIIAHPGGYELEVMDADPRRVRRLRIRPIAPASTPA